MKLFLSLLTAAILTVPHVSALTFTYSGVVQTVESGAAWSLTGLEIGARFEASLRIADELLGQELFPVYRNTGMYPVELEFNVAGHSLYLIPFYVSQASVNSAYEFGLWGEGAGLSANWGMWAFGEPSGATFGAAAGQYGGPGFTASAELDPPVRVPDSGNSGFLLAIAAAVVVLVRLIARKRIKGTES